MISRSEMAEDNAAIAKKLAENTRTLRVYTCTRFAGHNPVGVAAVIVATDPDHATRLLNRQLRLRRLKGNAAAKDMIEVTALAPHAIILNDGDY